ncbi:MAG TPA: hypothetical protein VHS31_12060 [Tepidisphaeraceae bacterium]|jgi:hypothetical protein|nr:hypothetical protein [Tepidisphaeraceae bacterium]
MNNEDNNGLCGCGGLSFQLNRFVFVHASASSENERGRQPVTEPF